MSIADWNAATLDQFVGDKLDRPEMRRRLTAPVAAPTAPTFATGWSNFGAPYNNADYYLDRGRVYLRGAVKNGGTGTNLILTLPPGFRPPAAVLLRQPTGAILIANDGTVTDTVFDASSKAITSLDGLSFRVAS